MSFTRLLPLMALLWIGVVPDVQAQEYGRVEDVISRGTSYHVFTRPGAATIQVQVVGGVVSSGIYEINIDTDLGQLLALAGGLPLASQNPNVRREVTVQLYRGEAGRRAVIYEAPYQEFLAEPERYPKLQEGDVVTVEAKEHQRFTWRNALAVVGSVAGVVLVLDRMFDFLPGRGR